MQDFISVITPAHNAARFLRATAASVLKQTHGNLELLIIDDGSTDETGEIATEISRADDRVRLIQTARKGVSAARNLGLSQAGGDLIATLDADDLWHPNKLEWQLAALKSASEKTGVIYCWSVGINEDDQVVLPAWNDATASGFVLNDLIVGGILGNGSTPLMRRSAILAAGGYDDSLSLCEDWKFYTALAGVCEFAVVPEFMTGYRLHDSTSLNVDEMEQAIAGVTDWIMKRWPSVPDQVLRERDHVVNSYLATIAIRARKFSDAIRYLSSALRFRPGKVVDPSYARLWLMLIVHAAGFRIYRWDFWRAPDFADFCAARRSRVRS